MHKKNHSSDDGVRARDRYADLVRKAIRKTRVGSSMVLSSEDGVGLFIGSDMNYKPERAIRS